MISKFDALSSIYYTAAFFAKDSANIYKEIDVKRNYVSQNDDPNSTLTPSDLQKAVSDIIETAEHELKLVLPLPRRNFKTARGLFRWAQKVMEIVSPLYLAEWKANEAREEAERQARTLAAEAEQAPEATEINCSVCGDPTDAKDAAARASTRCPSCARTKASLDAYNLRQASARFFSELAQAAQTALEQSAAEPTARCPVCGLSIFQSELEAGFCPVCDLPAERSASVVHSEEDHTQGCTERCKTKEELAAEQAEIDRIQAEIAERAAEELEKKNLENLRRFSNECIAAQKTRSFFGPKTPTEPSALSVCPEGYPVFTMPKTGFSRLPTAEYPEASAAELPLPAPHPSLAGIRLSGILVDPEGNATRVDGIYSGAYDENAACAGEGAL